MTEEKENIYKVHQIHESPLKISFIPNTRFIPFKGKQGDFSLKRCSQEFEDNFSGKYHVFDNYIEEIDKDPEEWKKSLKRMKGYEFESIISKDTSEDVQKKLNALRDIHEEYYAKMLEHINKNFYSSSREILRNIIITSKNNFSAYDSILHKIIRH